MNVVHPNLTFGELSKRADTDVIVIHHTGERDIDASAEQIHEWHLNQGWSGIGCHFVIRKDGTLEIGRPEWSVGSHAYGHNYYTLGIHLSGDFETAYPTLAQIQTCAELIRDLCRDYDIPVDRHHIIGHCDLMATECPGKILYSQIGDIIALAQNVPPPNKNPTPVKNITDLAIRYESNGDPAAVGNGYGLFQFTKTTAKNFVDWLRDYPDDKLANYGRYLDGARNFDGEWQMLGTVDPGHFGDLQTEFALKNYFEPAVEMFAKENFSVKNHSIALQAVVFARAIQHGVFGCIELFNRTCRYPNLSYVDSPDFDREIIAAVYDYLIAHPSYGRACHNLDNVLRTRFVAEKAGALA